jgi:hypothetical protein
MPERLTPAEHCVAWAIRLTWVFYATGALYIVGPVLGWTLATMVSLGLYFGEALKPAWRAAPVPSGVWVWIGGMLVMLIVLVIGHSNFGLGMGKTIKSSIGWAKGWALLALFPLAGACLPVRPAVIYRACAELGLQTLLLLPVMLAAPYVGLPEALFVSPLKAVGGPGPEFFTLQLYTIDPGTGAPRWQFFTPWAPAAGMMGVVMLLCSLEERNLRWRLIGIASAMAMILLSKSRMALVAFALIWPAAHVAARVTHPALWTAGAGASAVAGLLANWLLVIATDFVSAFKGARADSTRVRETLGRIAVDRWWHEGRWFGHGIVERGPHLVEYMPIGSHHSWYGLLFVKGVFGVLALALPMLVSCAQCLARAQRDPLARVGLSMLLMMFLYSFGENLEILVYLFWPGCMLLGMALRPPRFDYGAATR